MTRRVILDVDTGTDDAVALMCAALHPELELVAATTVHGNVDVESATLNTLAVLAHIGSRAPVYRGLSRPIERPDLPVPRASLAPERGARHPRDLGLPLAHTARADAHAVDFLVEYYDRPGRAETTLVALAPLSNLAAALRRKPGIARFIPELVVMGGRCGDEDPGAEFNLWADPEAAQCVLSSGIPTRLVLLDATRQAPVSQADCAALRACGSPAGTSAADLIETRITASPEDRTPVHDALALLSVVRPSILQNIRACHVDVETDDPQQLGRTVFSDSRAPNCRAAFAADAPGFVRLLRETLARAL